MRLSAPAPLLVLLCAACVGIDPAPFSTVAKDDDDLDDDDDDGVSADCPPEMVLLGGGPFELGETDEDALADHDPTMVVRATEFTIDRFCVAKLPFPGDEGAAWPRDGLSLDQLPALEALLAPTGRRTCTVPELLLAAAGPDNHRYPYSPTDHVPGTCDPDAADPDPLASWPDCVSPLGVRDFMVRSTWARVTDDLVAALEPHGFPWPSDDPRSHVPYGGIDRRTTHYAASNFGIHTHGAGEEAYSDDGLRLCADEGPASEDETRAWEDLLQRYAAGGRFVDLLAGD